MDDKRYRLKRYVQLRKRAESLLDRDEASPSLAMTAAEIHRLLVELHSYQVELEQQNAELHLAREALLASRGRYQELYDFAPIGYFSLDAEGILLECNLTTSAMLGQERRHLNGRSFSGFVGPDDQDVYLRYLQNLKTANSRLTCEVRLQPDRSDTFWARLDGVHVSTKEGETLQYRLAISDVTRQKKTELDLLLVCGELENKITELQTMQRQLLHAEKMSTIGKLSTTFAHECNNPLYGIMNILEGIKRKGLLNAEDSKLIDLAYSECRRIKELIRNFQEFNRPTTACFEQVDIHKATDTVLLLTRGKFKTGGIILEKRYDPNLPLVEAVADQVVQVIMNMVDNAIDACGQEGVIRISTEAADTRIILRIQDNGKGIRPEQMPFLFQPFFTTKSADQQGSGLGLSICHTIVRRHGGSIEVESEPGQGAAFIVTLPVRQQDK